MDIMGRAARATAQGFAVARELLKPGVTERALQIEMEAAFHRAGAGRTGYGTVVGSGPNSRCCIVLRPKGRCVVASSC